MEIIEFLGRPTVRDNVRSKLAEGSYFMTGIVLLMMVLMTFSLLITSISAGDTLLKMFGTLFCGYIILVSGLASMIVMVFIVGMFGVAITKDSTWDRDRDLVIRIDDRHLTVDQEFISFFGIRRVNKIPLSLIERVSKDVEPYLREKGIRVPWWYKPICHSAPSERKHPSLLYANMGRANMPFDHLMRIDLIVPYPIIAIKRHHPDYPKYEKMLDTVIITVRPADQHRFTEELMMRVKKAKENGLKRTVVGPPLAESIRE